MKKQRLSLFLVLIALLLGCSFAPKFERPLMVLPCNYKESDQWKPAHSAKILQKNEFWWRLFKDPVLNDLEQKLDLGNQDLKGAFARFQEARAVVQVARSYLYPTLLGLANANRQQTSKHVANVERVTHFSDFMLGSTFSYEVDLWGSIRNSIIASESSARATAAQMDALALSLHAELARDYFVLRGYELSQKILDKTVSAYQLALNLIQRKYKQGVVSIADVDEAKTQLEQAKTLAADMNLQRAKQEHAIAILIGEVPANFCIQPSKLAMKPIELSPDLPSTLLERRPDIAAAEERVRAANAEIGVASAAFFPTINLSSILGVESKTLANLISAPSTFWSLGSINALSITQPALANLVIFDGGHLRGLLEEAKASYFETVASYRQTVLKAFQDVEDSLAEVRWLAKENKTQSRAAVAAKQALAQSRHRYNGGITDYLNVVYNENIALKAELALVDIKIRRQLASVQLIRALGGGWGSLPLS